MKKRWKVFVALVIAQLLAFWLLSQTNIVLICRSGISEGANPLLAVWAYFNTDFAPDFSERRFLTIRAGDSEVSVIEKIGQPRTKPSLPEKPILWVYGYAAWDNAGWVYYGRNIEFDDSGHVINVSAYLDVD